MGLIWVAGRLKAASLDYRQTGRQKSAHHEAFPTFQTTASRTYSNGEALGCDRRCDLVHGKGPAPALKAVPANRDLGAIYGRCWARTSDLLLVRQALSQLS